MSTAKVIVVFIAVMAIVFGSEDESQPDAPPPENGIADKSGCAGEFLEWCRNISTTSDMNYGVSVFLMDYLDQGQRVRIFCMRNSSVINCTRDDLSWFLCDSDGNLKYKGEELKPGYEDDDICKTKDRARRMFRPPIPFNRTAFDTEMKLFRTKMTELAKRMKELGFQGPFRNRPKRVEGDDP